MSVLFWLSAFLAEVVGTVAGFGSSTIFLPLALLFLPFETALVLVAFAHVFGNLGRVGWFRHGLDRKMLVNFGVPSVLLSLTGAYLVNFINQELLKNLLGWFLILYAFLSLGGLKPLTHVSTKGAMVGGAISGFLAGLIGTGGALRAVFLTGMGLKKETYIATAAAIAIAVDVTRIPVYLINGFLPNNYLAYLPVLLALALAGSYLGKKIVVKWGEGKFRKVVLLALMLVGAKLVL